jgi:ubiquinone/menaquinone biosynthesis C-methylase UbiE
MSKAKRMAGSIRFMELWNMNYRHSKATDWGLGHVCVEQDFTILDVGCGGGRTLSKLATAATQGKVYGIDYSKESVAVTKRTNARWVEMGRIEVRQAPVSQLPFQDGMFDLVTVSANYTLRQHTFGMGEDPSPLPSSERSKLPHT